jgi:predicted dehydrogenase
MEVTVVACGAPKRGMGWYHCKQMLDGRVPGAKLVDIVEPFFLGAGKDSEAGKEFAAWSKKAGVTCYKSISEMPKPQGPKLVLICGRTADNPRLFREAVDHGFSHVYLEKPGAPSVTELEEMAAYARSKGVPVFMGYNRNFSKYVRQAHDYAAKNPSTNATFTLSRKDTFNTSEALDECFERNAEGMMKNMMCHELVVLLTYYGLTVDGIKTVIPDQEYTHSETRVGFTDFSRVGFTIITKEGRKFKLCGDRSGGEHAEAIVSSGDKELFKAMRPDPEIIAQGKALEESEPGCMPYFYLQDAEYIGLKSAVVDHILKKRAGQPEGVASIETAIEALKVCDYITDALKAPKFEFKLNISAHPCSWGVDYADSPYNPPWEKVIQCMADGGYAGTELGPVGYYDPERLPGLLKSLNLQLVAGNIFEKLEEPSELPGILAKVHKSCETLQKLGAKFFVIVPHVAPERIATAGRPADAPRLSDDRWAQYMDAIKQCAEVTKTYGIQATVHPHAGCWLEYDDEVERAMKELPLILLVCAWTQGTSLMQAWIQLKNSKNMLTASHTCTSRALTLLFSKGSRTKRKASGTELQVVSSANLNMELSTTQHCFAP